MPNLYSVNIRWVKTQADPTRVELVLSRYGDWLRFDAYSWLCGSEHNAYAITNALRGALNIEDSILVLKCDLSDYNGFAQQWVWDWVAKYLPSNQGLGSLTPRGNALSHGLAQRIWPENK
jgi:hypothetical protein